MMRRMGRSVAAYTFSLVAVCSFLVFSGISSDTAQAYNRVARNVPEQNARTRCINGTQGAIWFSDSSSMVDGGYNAGFYKTGVTVDYNQDYVTVYIHGSANTCLQPGNFPWRTFYGIRVAPGAPNASRLTGLSSTIFSRGQFDGAYNAYDWTSIPSSNGQITATLNVSGIASPGTTASFTVGLYRCPSYDKTTVTGNCDTEPITVTVTRKPAPINWTIGGWSTVNDQTSINATPNQPVTFKHYVKNNGPNNTGTDIWTDTIGRNNGGSQFTVRGGHTEGPLTSGQTRQVDTQNFTIPAGANPGDTYCQRVGYQPRASNDGAYGAGGFACANVVLDYLITPLADAPSVAGPGATISVTYKAQNAGTKTNATYWAYRSFALPAGANPSYLGQINNNITNPSSFYYGSSNFTSTGGPGTFTMVSGETKTLHTQSFTIPANASPGSRYCFVASVDSRDENAPPNNSDSIPACVLIANRPYLSMVGGDGWAANTATTPSYSFAGAQGSVFGTFGDYGVFASKRVNYFGSAGRIGVPLTASGYSNAPLTFANANPLGGFSTVHSVYNPSSQYSAASVTTTSPAPLNGGAAVTAPGAPVTGGGIYKDTALTSTLHIAASVLQANAGHNAVIYVPNATVRITGDIKYNSAGARSFAALPSLTIIAKNIEVVGAVARIDAMLYAKEQFVSCAEGPRAAGADPANNQITTGGECRRSLVLNGSLSIGSYVTNKQPVFNRSYGGMVEGQSAEITRMRPEVFLTPYERAYATNKGLLRTVSEVELPPRY